MNERATRYEMIQVLRFVAATLVVCGHSLIHVGEKIPMPALPTAFFAWSGGWSVTLFFCISGFVITHTAQKMNSLEFILRRFLRIYSGYFLAVLLVFVAKGLIFHGFSTAEISFGALSLFPLGTIPYPLWIEWSLVFEVFFYVLFAIVWITKSNRVVLATAAIWLALISLNSMSESSPRLVTIGQVFLSARNIPFILGVFSYFIFSKISDELRRLLLVAGIALAFTANIFVSDFWIIVGQSVSALCLVLWAANAKISGKSFFVVFGNYSYGIYLVHTSVIMIILSGTPLIGTGALTTLVTAFLLAMMVGLLFGFIEHHVHERLKNFLLHDTLIGRWIRTSSKPHQPLSAWKKLLGVSAVGNRGD